MDVFPFVTELYEEQRKPANERSRRALQLDVPHELGAMVEEAYGVFFRRTGPEEQLDRSQEDCEAKPDFERFLANLSTVKGLAVPDLFHTLAAAQSMMTDAFCRELTEVLMRFDWARPDERLDLPILAPGPSTGRSGVCATYISRDGKRSPGFYVGDRAPRAAPSVAIPAPREWEKHEPLERTPPYEYGGRRAWDPPISLFTALSCRATQIAQGASDERTIEPFEGSLREGLDPKATLRGEIRGEKRPYVRDILRRRKPAPEEQDDPFPIVWIFRLEEDPQTDWYAKWGYDLVDFRDHVEKQDLLDQAMARSGRQLESVTYERRGPEPHSRRPQDELTRIDLQGCLHFAPPHFSLRQAAIWGEATGYERCPLVPPGMATNGIPGLKAALSEQHGLECDWSDWTTTMIRMAVAYALRTVIVVAPDGFALPRAVHGEARQRGKDVRVAPLSYFPRHETRKLTVLHTLPCQHEPVPKFPPWAARELGGSPTAYRDLIPPRWREYGLKGQHDYGG